MDGYQLLWAILGLGIAGTALTLVRRGWVHNRHVFWWLLIALTVTLAGMFPEHLSRMAHWLGVESPPAMLLILGLGLVVVKMLLMDIHSSNLERRVHRLAQQIAILEEAQRRPSGQD